MEKLVLLLGLLFLATSCTRIETVPPVLDPVGSYTGTLSGASGTLDATLGVISTNNGYNGTFILDTGASLTTPCSLSGQQFICLSNDTFSNEVISFDGLYDGNAWFGDFRLTDIDLDIRGTFEFYKR